MNWFARNLVVVVFGAATSVLTAVALLLLEARSGTAVFGMTFLKLPLGTILAGFLGAVGYLAAALALRLRPAILNVTAIMAVAAGVVFMVQSAEFAFFMGGSTQAAAMAADTGTFTRFLGNSLMHSPLEFWGSDDGNGAAATMFFARSGNAGPGPRVMSGDSRVDGIGSGVDGMMATQDVSNTSAAKHAAKIGAGIQTMGAKVKSHGSVWSMLVFQMLGFAVGGLVVFGHLRTLPHCKDCMLLLNDEGQRTRYFSRIQEMRSAVDEILARARENQLQQSILAHASKGSGKRQEWSEYCSTFVIRRCIACNTYELDFHTLSKSGSAWKKIELMGFSTETLEPLKFV